MKKIISIILSVLSFVCMSATFVGCGSQDVLKVGVTDYKPLDYKNDAGEWIGFDADLAKEVGSILGKKVEFIEINWNNKVLSINAGEIDVIWNGMTITDELSEALLISSPYNENTQVIVCQKSVIENYTSKESLNNATEILVEGGSAGEAAVRGVSGIDGTKIKTAEAQVDCLLEVLASANKVCVIDKIMAQSLVNKDTSYKDLAFVEVGFAKEQFGIGFRKSDSELMASVENAIATLKQNGKYDEIYDKYLGD